MWNLNVCQLPLELVVCRYCLIAGPAIRKSFAPNCCIAATWITIEVLRRFGFFASPIEVELTILNPLAAMDVATRNHPLQRRPGSWVVGTSAGGCADNMLGGHLVTMVGGLIVDASIDQANDVTHGIDLPMVVHFSLGPRFRRDGVLVRRVNDCLIHYVLKAAPRDYSQSIFWGHDPRLVPVVNEIVTSIEAASVGSPSGQS